MSEMYVVTCDVIQVSGIKTLLVGVFDEPRKAESAAQAWFDDLIKWDARFFGKARVKRTKWVLEHGADVALINVACVELNEALPRPSTKDELRQILKREFDRGF